MQTFEHLEYSASVLGRHKPSSCGETTKLIMHLPLGFITMAVSLTMPKGICSCTTVGGLKFVRTCSAWNEHPFYVKIRNQMF